MEAATTTSMIMEERAEEVMLVRRSARFLTPTLSSSTASFDLSPTAFRSYHQNLAGLHPNHVSFPGWKNLMPRWSEWVDQMKLVHRATWQRAGIFEAIMASKCHIKQDVNLVMVLAERWCKGTNTFVFPWGEATVTLEDIMILGGYSVLGNSILSPVENQDYEEFVTINQNLNLVRTDINKTKARRVSHPVWMSAFMGNGGLTEHVAFLVLWLSRHVFPSTHDTIQKIFHKIGFMLSKGKRFALAPSVLACLYRDMKSLKEKIMSMSEERVSQEKLNIWAQIQFVQIWAWERFPSLEPQPNFRFDGEPRMGCWKNTGKKWDLESVRVVINNTGEEFIWRPYSMSEIFDFYSEKDQCVSTFPHLREDYKAFIKIVKVSDLIGPGCIESYSPNRVSMQFGIDQDIPGKVVSSQRNPEVAWEMFNRYSEDEILYIPSRVFRGGITRRYQTWWNNLRLGSDHVESSDRLSLEIPLSSQKKSKTIGEDIATSSTITAPQVPIYPPGFEPSVMKKYDDVMAEQPVKEREIGKSESGVEKSQMQNVRTQGSSKRKIDDQDDHDPLNDLRTEELLSLAIAKKDKKRINV